MIATLLVNTCADGLFSFIHKNIFKDRSIFTTFKAVVNVATVEIDYKLLVLANMYLFKRSAFGRYITSKYGSIEYDIYKNDYNLCKIYRWGGHLVSFFIAMNNFDSIHNHYSPFKYEYTQYQS